MKSKVIRFGVFILVVFHFVLIQNQAIAQDTGAPALKTVAIFSLGGGAGGAVLGLAVWMLDPLDPDSDLRLSAASGMGAGFLVGFIFGIMQLNKQAVLPYSDPGMGNEFQGRIDSYPYIGEKNRYYSDNRKRKSSHDIPILRLKYKF
jgi:hypothetical protein